MSLRSTIVLALNLLCCNLARAEFLAPGDHHLSLNSGGVVRSYLLHVPPADSSMPMPIVMMLHGAGGSSATAAANFNWIPKSDSEHFLAVFPQGLPPDPTRPAGFLVNRNLWNDNRPEVIPHPRPDDVAFLGAVLDDVERQCNADPNRIYITGFSNGASMTFFLATQLSSRIAAIAPVSGHCFLDDAKLSHPIPLMLIVGDADPENPLAGGLAKTRAGLSTTKPAMFDSIDDWLRFDNQSNIKSITQTKGGVTTQTYSTGTNCPIIFITIAGQGHEWPGGRRALPPAISGNDTTTFDATTVIWNFFKDKSLKPAG